MNITELSRKIFKGHYEGKPRPHKLILLLALADLCYVHKHKNEFTLSEDLDETFEKYWKRYVLDQQYSRTLVELPFQYLSNDGFWHLYINDKNRAIVSNFPRLTRARINQYIEYGYLDTDLFETFTKFDCRNAIIKELATVATVQLPRNSMELQASTSEVNMSNPFLTYINSLHNLDGHSSGALAEQQACNPFFTQIQVKPLLVDEICSTLCNEEHGHYILTGHAGDGKSSIALQVYKQFRNIPFDQPLDSGLRPREDFTYNGIDLTLIKDLSEWNEQEQDSIFAEMASGKRRYLLISNTGCLLNLFKRHNDHIGKTQIEVENLLLEALDSPKEKSLVLGNIALTISNLALQDNTDLALQIWDKMLEADGWKGCESCLYHLDCPVYANLQILRKHKAIITERLRYLFRRTQLYGSRLTMRQYSAHFAYMLGSGINPDELIDRLAKGEKIMKDDFLFFNRFFGEAGGIADPRCTQMQSVEIFKKQGFETRLSAKMEHFLWLQDEGNKVKPGIAELSDFYSDKHGIACSENSEIHSKQELQNARRQLRRMFYFLYQPAESQPEYVLAFEQFKSCFVNSPVLLEYEQWLKDDARFSESRISLTEQIYQVLQEQFSGLRLPEGSQSSGKVLYMTLARRERDIRQSAQIVLGKLNFNDVFILRKTGEKIQLEIKDGKSNVPPLELPLPFLDYIFERKNGDIGTAIQPGFANRLETFKSQLLKDYRQYTDSSALVLIKQTSRNEIKQQRLSLANGKLEVSND